MRTKTQDIALTSTLHKVLERRGYQRFYYHAHEMILGHWWDTADALNNLQMELEKTYGDVPVELVSQWTQPHDKAIVLRSFFKIGPIPDPITPFRETVINPR